jgi:HK97 family phage major capsid protein
VEDNSFDLLGWASKKAVEVGILDQEKAYTIGSGLDQPVGFTQHPAWTTAVGSTVKVGNSTYTGINVHSGLAAALAWPIPSDSLDPTTYGLLGLSTSLPTQYEVGAKWFANKKTYGGIMGLTDANGRPLWYGTDASPFPQFVAGFPGMLLGYPPVRNVFMPNVSANSYPVAIGNMNAYYIVDRVGVTVEVFRETLALRDQVLIYLRLRTGGQLVDYYKLRSMQIAA